MATITKGTYKWNKDLTSEGSITPANGVTLPPLECSYNGINGIGTVEGVGYIQTGTTWGADGYVIRYFGTFNIYFNGTLMARTNAIATYIDGWNAYAYLQNAYVPLSSLLGGDDVPNYGQVFTIVDDVDHSGDAIPAVEWFRANTDTISTITYNGETIASATSGQTATIKCKGKVMETDIVITL